MTERTSTYLDHARAEAEQPPGRFAKQAASRVLGAPKYPQMPSNSHWARDVVPHEPPLGYRVDEVPDLGFERATDDDLGEPDTVALAAATPSAIETGSSASSILSNKLRRV